MGPRIVSNAGETPVPALHCALCRRTAVIKPPRPRAARAAAWSRWALTHEWRSRSARFGAERSEPPPVSASSRGRRRAITSRVWRTPRRPPTSVLPTTHGCQRALARRPRDPRTRDGLAKTVSSSADMTAAPSFSPALGTRRGATTGLLASGGGWATVNPVNASRSGIPGRTIPRLSAHRQAGHRDLLTHTQVRLYAALALTGESPRLPAWIDGSSYAQTIRSFRAQSLTHARCRSAGTPLAAAVQPACGGIGARRGALGGTPPRQRARLSASKRPGATARSLICASQAR
jgi:hypothetical protein